MPRDSKAKPPPPEKLKMMGVVEFLELVDKSTILNANTKYVLRVLSEQYKLNLKL